MLERSFEDPHIEVLLEYAEGQVVVHSFPGPQYFVLEPLEPPLSSFFHENVNKVMQLIKINFITVILTYSCRRGKFVFVCLPT